jgi:hypothetical protein
MCWTPSYTRHGVKTNKANNTTQYVLDTIIHKTRGEDKQSKKYNTICVGYHYTKTNTNNVNEPCGSVVVVTLVGGVVVIRR